MFAILYVELLVFQAELLLDDNSINSYISFQFYKPIFRFTLFLSRQQKFCKVDIVIIFLM